MTDFSGTDRQEVLDPEYVKGFMEKFTVKREVPIDQMNDVQLRELILEHDQTMVITSTLLSKFVQHFNALASRLVLIETFLVTAMSAPGDKPVSAAVADGEIVKVPTGQYL